MIEKTMTEFSWPDVSDPKVRKCPRHKAWVQSNRGPVEEGRPYVRYCPRCLMEQQHLQAQQQKEAGLEKPQVRIMKI